MVDQNFVRVSEEVIASQNPVTKITAEDISSLKDVAQENTRHRARICAHHSSDDPVHEMLLVMMEGIYVQPHKHVGKSESFHVIEGMLSVILFDDDGKPLERIRMGDYASGRNFYYRLETETYHTVIPETEFVVFHETTKGPFRKKFTEYADWAPSDDAEEPELKRFVESLPD